MPNEELMEYLRILLNLNLQVLNLHAPSEDGETCQYCENEYPCRTVRVAKGDETVQEWVNTNPPTLDEIKDRLEAEQRAQEQRLREQQKKLEDEMSLTKCTICGYRIDKDQEREVDKSRLSKDLQAKHKSPSGCAESMRRYRKKGWDSPGNNVYYHGRSQNHDGP